MVIKTDDYNSFDGLFTSIDSLIAHETSLYPSYTPKVSKQYCNEDEQFNVRIEYWKGNNMFVDTFIAKPITPIA